MPTAEEVRKNLEFKTIANGLVSYRIKNGANGDNWKTIEVIYNARTSPIDYELDENLKIAVLGDDFDFKGAETANGTIKVPPISMAVLFKE